MVRCAAMSEIKRLLLKYKHERIPKTSNGSKTSQREWISALTGLVFLCSNKHDTTTRDLVCRYGGPRFLLSLTQHNSHWIRRVSVGALANLLTSCVDKKTRNMNASIVKQKNTTALAFCGIYCAVPFRTSKPWRHRRQPAV